MGGFFLSGGGTTGMYTLSQNDAVQISTHTGILTASRSRIPYGTPSVLLERSPTILEVGSRMSDVRFVIRINANHFLFPTSDLWFPTSKIRGFGVRLEPRYIFGAGPLDQ